VKIGVLTQAEPRTILLGSLRHTVFLTGGKVFPTTPNSSITGFVAPTFGGAGGTSTFQLTVTDSHGASSTANAQVNVLPNRPPTVDAGPDQNVNEFAVVSLAGSGTDPDGNSLMYTWSQFSGPTVTLSDPRDPNATFIAPDVACGGGAVVMTLTADDGYGGTDSKNVTINVANVNHPPTANGGGNQQVNEEDLVNLHGTGQDVDSAEGASLTFQWTQTSGNPVSLSGSGQDVSFTAPDIPGGDPNAFLDLGFQLTVTTVCGDSVTSATDDITVTVKNVAHPPIAVATGPTMANEGGDTVQLDGSNSSDPDGEQLTYAWEQTAGPTVTLVGANSAMPSFTTPWVSADTPVKFKLTVSTKYGFTNSAYVAVTIKDWNQPPVVTNAHADVPVLWPPDHRMVPVHIAGVVDPNSNDTITITGVTQDEPTNGLGDGDTPIDAIISGDSVLLRAERSGKGDGRVYWVYFTASDPETVALGNSPTGIVKVMVPHDKKTDTAIDSGQKYDSTK
jgi:chitinase